MFEDVGVSPHDLRRSGIDLQHLISPLKGLDSLLDYWFLQRFRSYGADDNCPFRRCDPIKKTLSRNPGLWLVMVSYIIDVV